MQRVHSPLPPEVIAHYAQGGEFNRLLEGRGQLERIRTEQILQKFLPNPPATILDVGGGAGIYALPLAEQGYRVHLIDPVPLHIQQAQALSQKPSSYSLASIVLGDARAIPMEDACADAILYLGPLYHLTERGDRIQAIQEAYRTLKTGGTLFVVGISRFASLLDGLARGFLQDPAFRSIVETDLDSGQHRNPTNNPQYFTTAFFHHPEELRVEIEECGFRLTSLIAVEGPAWIAPLFEDYWQDECVRMRLLSFIQRVEEDSTILGVSAHMMAIAQK